MNSLLSSYIEYFGEIVLLTYIKKHFCYSIFLLSFSCHFVLAADITSDYAREQRWAKEVVPDLIVGKALYLTQKNGHEFLSLLAEAENKNIAIIVAHGMGLHPNWGMVSNLRLGLFDYGYTTLSIQMPILAADASYKLYPSIFPDAAERLQVATQYLKRNNYKKIIIVSHSNGSRMSRIFMKENPENIAAWVAISLTQGDAFTGIKAPIFDLYGDADLPHVLSSAHHRKRSLKNKKSNQMFIEGANHFFSGKEDLMVETVTNFINNLTF